jgi:hypothetical protein
LESPSEVVEGVANWANNITVAEIKNSTEPQILTYSLQMIKREILRCGADATMVPMQVR